MRKLRLTGGEPLLRTNLADLIGDLTGIPEIEDIALTTNGVLLAQHAVDLHANGLRRVTVSLDTLDKDIFARMSGGFGALDQVLHGIDAAIAAGLSPVKINAVIERGVNDQGALDLLERFRGMPVIVRFIEFMDVGNRNAVASGNRGAVARAGRAHPGALADASDRRELPRRGGAALALRRRRGRSRIHFLGVAAFLRNLQPGAPVLRGQVLHLPVRDPRPQPARRDAQRRDRRRPCCK